MADNDQVTTDTQPQQPQAPIMVSPQFAIADTQRAIAEASRIAELEQKDESKFPGGRYLLPSGVYVDAEGNKHKDQKSE